MSAALDRIVAQASTLWEQPATDDPALIERWCERAASGDPAAFAKRRSWLAGHPFRPAHSDWPSLLVDALETKTCSPCASDHPFGSVLECFVRAAATRLAPICTAVFSEQALHALEDSLRADLSYLASPCLYLEFTVFREQQRSPGVYDCFVARLLHGALWDFFLEYSALARLLSITALQWAAYVSELAEFLTADSAQISRVFAQEQPLGNVAHVKPALSDMHDDGRRVAKLRFESGLSLIYKPRNIGIEQGWFELLEWLNQRGGEFRILRVLNCNSHPSHSHGWAEAVEHAPCASLADARAFYDRAGQLLAVLYLVEASDCFYENVIAQGAWPVLVDMETLMHHVLRQTDPLTRADAAAEDILFDSVLRPGFLPAWESGAHGTCVDISALGAKAGQVTPYQTRVWERVNQDDMLLRHVPLRVPSEDHLPELAGRSLRAADYIDDIVAGFERMYRLLMNCRNELCAPSGALDVLGKHEIRFVLHATRIYGLLLKRLAAPCHMRNGAERSIETDVLSRFYLGNAQKERLAAVLEAELAALENLNIPRFTVLADSHGLSLPTGPTIQNAFERTAVERVRSRFAAMSEIDLQVQSGLIRASLEISAVSVHERSAETGAPVERHAAKPELVIPDLVIEALRIADEITKRGIRSPDGGMTWIAPQLLPGASHHQLSPLRMDLYNGLPGIALFFAAVYGVTGTSREQALAALQPVQRFLASATPQRLTRFGYTLGAATGVGSLIYALCRCAGLLGEADLYVDAARAARLITPEWIAADDAFDVMSGSAGAVLGLLTLHQSIKDEFALETAIACGNQLLARQRPLAAGAAWPTKDGQHFMTGLSHGAAGIAMALQRLSQASGEAKFEAAAAEAIAFENSTFDPVERNWPDFRYHTPARPSFMSTWCHGAPGIGLARLAGCLPLGNAYHDDLSAALDAVRTLGIGGKDGLCCGNLGRADLLLCAERTQHAQLGDCRTIDLSTAVIRRARDSGAYRLTGRPGQEFFDPSLFQGLSGVGYELLRVAHPSLVPSVLIWQ